MMRGDHFEKDEKIMITEKPIESKIISAINLEIVMHSCLPIGRLGLYKHPGRKSNQEKGLTQSVSSGPADQ